MYLPRNLPLSRPHVAMWIGASGKPYDFAVCRPGTICVDEPAVYILARHEEQGATPLFVGHTTSLHRHFGLSRERCPEEWRRALAMGMTHVHLRFDTFSKMTREAEVTDLVAALAPVLNDQLVLDEERSLPPLETESAASAPIDRTRVYHRERPDVGGRVQSPALAAVGSDRHISAERAVPPPLFRADPAREDDGEPGDFELPVAVDTPPDGQPWADMRPTTVTFEEFEQEVEVVQLAPAEPAATPAVQREPDGRLTAASLPESADVVRTTESAKSAQLQRLIARVREFVDRDLERLIRCTRLQGLIVRRRAPRRPDALDDAGWAEMPPVPAAAPALPVTRPAAAAAELYAETGEARDTAPEDTGEARDTAREDEARDTALEDTTPIQQEYIADAKPAVTAEDTSPEPTAAEATSISHLEAKRGLNLDASAPVVLFAGDLSYNSGVDILFDAIVTVCGGNHEAQFLFVGEGALRGELQERASRGGLERRCRFFGHVPAGSFERVLIACDFLVIPARVPQGEDLARMAIVAGKPVVTTHQAAIPLIVHGRNGLVAYDNPGSLVWAIRALLGPLYASLRLHPTE